MPRIEKGDDCLKYIFDEPLRVSTPGPDAKLSEIRHYEDRIEFSVWPFVDVVIEVVE